MTPNELLTDLFSSAESAKRQVRVSFANGYIYDLQIISTWHAEAGGDVVADVIKSIVDPRPERWKAAALNFKLDAVVRVESQGESLFSRYDDQPTTTRAP